MKVQVSILSYIEPPGNKGFPLLLEGGGASRVSHDASADKVLIWGNGGLITALHLICPDTAGLWSSCSFDGKVLTLP